MNKLLMLAGASALLAGTPALADPDHGHGHGRGGDRDHGWNDDRGCPPGLAKKHNGCMPPGQYKKRWSRGDRWQSGYGNYYSYNRIPRDWRDRYDLNQNYRYYYNDGYLYGVDPRTSVIQQVIQGLLR
ncbi:hypothetical protein HMF7854_13815 [Sphingomonas ginkgonis]|uniref:Uncharacterized protein n=1 Tax=Sphingomonas ginkgonis TaxID=2315330 RepID=A0A3R9WQA8_9SPHN|nr:hypothetical protein [Sphingomonas ginkgonis]RST31791.1 hypothetical protein HMF7854_13815 [Sphingomonas ginkgonis]